MEKEIKCETSEATYDVTNPNLDGKISIATKLCDETTVFLEMCVFIDWFVIHLSIHKKQNGALNGDKTLFDMKTIIASQDNFSTLYWSNYKIDLFQLRMSQSEKQSNCLEKNIFALQTENN